MKALIGALILALTLSPLSVKADVEIPEMEEITFSKRRVPGSKWVTLRCGTWERHSTFCPAPHGFKIRTIDSRSTFGGRCQSAKNFRWYPEGILVAERCRVHVRAFLVPAIF